MKIKIGDFQGNIINAMRQAGYHPDRNGRKGELSFSKSLRGVRYPRFHIYYNLEKKELNLHLDQKAPKYKKTPDHGAEYDSKLVKEEGKRIKNLLKQ